MTYTLTSGSSVIRDADGASIPSDPLNTDWSLYQHWLSEGNTPSPVPVPPVLVPQSVSDRQFFQASAHLGLITESDALNMMSMGVIPPSLLVAIGTLPADQQFSTKMQIIGNRTFERQNPLVLALSASMGLTPAQVDALFTLASTL
jgi:hypothetical protein